MATSRAFLLDLRREIESHPAVNHLLLNRLATTPFSRDDYRVFAENHFPLVCMFTSYLEMLLLRAPDSESKLWLAKVLVDEYGEGSEGKDHATLYGRFLAAAGGSPEAMRTRRVPAASAGFVAEHRRIVRTRPFLEGMGAVGPGHEWAIPRMFEATIPGLRRAGFSEDEIHYFTLHVAQDEDHGRWLEEGLARAAHTPEAQAEIRRGALASLDARGRFWDGVQRAITRWRQPRAARPDGDRPRSMAHEVLLTAWDGVAWARDAERRWDSWRDARRPTLARLVESAKEVT